MTANFPSPSKLVRLRRDARRLAREHAIALHEAQDRIAARLGYANWSLMAKAVSGAAKRNRSVHHVARDLHHNESVEPAQDSFLQPSFAVFGGYLWTASKVIRLDYTRPNKVDVEKAIEAAQLELARILQS